MLCLKGLSPCHCAQSPAFASIFNKKKKSHLYQVFKMGLGHILSNTLLLTYFQEGPTNNTMYVTEGKDKLQAELWKGTNFFKWVCPWGNHNAKPGC